MSIRPVNTRKPGSLDHAAMIYMFLVGYSEREPATCSCGIGFVFFNESLPDNVRLCLRHTYMYAQPIHRSLKFNSTPSETAAAGKAGADFAVHRRAYAQGKSGSASAS